jgi:GNAT superfamily N-acetyltransferase
MSNEVAAIETTLRDQTWVRVEPLPSAHEDVRDFLIVHSDSYKTTYTGLPCTANGRPDSIQLADMQDLYNPDDKDHARSILSWAKAGFDPYATESRLYLRARMVDVNHSELFTTGTINIKLGSGAIAATAMSGESRIVAKVHEINVRQENTRRGIGTLLLRTAIGILDPHFDDNDSVNLMVAVCNKGARQWYTELGMPPTGRGKTILWGERKVGVRLEERRATLATLKTSLGLS